MTKHTNHEHRLSALDEIDAALQPIGPQPRLRTEVERLVESKDVSALVALYDSYAASANAFMSLENQLRSSGTQKFLEEERAHAWSKALYCADRLKALRPDKGDLEQYAATMFNCTIAMGGNLDEACEVVSMTAEAWHRRHAIQIAAALPETPEDALLVLGACPSAGRGVLGGASARTARRRGARARRGGLAFEAAGWVKNPPPFQASKSTHGPPVAAARRGFLSFWGPWPSSGGRRPCIHFTRPGDGAAALAGASARPWGPCGGVATVAKRDAPHGGVPALSRET